MKNLKEMTSGVMGAVVGTFFDESILEFDEARTALLATVIRTMWDALKHIRNDAYFSLDNLEFETFSEIEVTDEEVDLILRFVFEEFYKIALSHSGIG